MDDTRRRGSFGRVDIPKDSPHSIATYTAATLAELERAWAFRGYVTVPGRTSNSRELPCVTLSPSSSDVDDEDDAG